MSEPGPPRRRLLGKAHRWSERVRVYWTDEALELDHADHYEIRRYRVFFDEILLVTLHRGRRMAAAAAMGLVAFVWAMVVLATLGSSGEGTEVVRGIFLVLSVLFAGLALFFALVPVWEVTVFGKRTRARMRFPLGQNRARAAYAEICRAAAEAQRALAARRTAPPEETAPPPPPPPELPLSAGEPPPPPLPLDTS